MRKIVIDGSNTSGFQRTMLVATGGSITVGNQKVGVQSICLEEDASKLISDEKKARRYGLDRLGVPLVEIALEPITGKPDEIKQVALTLGRLLRASRRVARGLGTIRQDVNISILGGGVVEVKGVQQIDQLVAIIEFEMKRQHGLYLIAKELKKRLSSVTFGELQNVTAILSKSGSSIIQKILESGPDSSFRAMKIEGFVGMLGFEPYPGIRLGKELGKLVSFYGLNGIFHSDELPNYGIGKEEVEEIKSVLKVEPTDAFVIVGGPRYNLELAISAIQERIRIAIDGAPAETRAANQDGQTQYLRPRPGSARMYPETDIPPIVISRDRLIALADKVPQPWDQLVDSISNKYSINHKLANQILDSDYLDLFFELMEKTEVNPTFAVSKLTEDIVSLERKGLDSSALTDAMIREIFKRLSDGLIAKESVIAIFEILMKKEASSVDEAVANLGAVSISDVDLSNTLDRILMENADKIKSKGASAIGTLMGRAMAELRGRADGQKINSMLKEKLARMVNS